MIFFFFFLQRGEGGLEQVIFFSKNPNLKFFFTKNLNRK